MNSRDGGGSTTRTSAIELMRIHHIIEDVSYFLKRLYLGLLTYLATSVAIESRVKSTATRPKFRH
jgi:hypothetical protein